MVDVVKTKRIEVYVISIIMLTVSIIGINYIKISGRFIMALKLLNSMMI